jgi:hypothetical protein
MLMTNQNRMLRQDQHQDLRNFVTSFRFEYQLPEEKKITLNQSRKILSVFFLPLEQPMLQLLDEYIMHLYYYPVDQNKQLLVVIRRCVNASPDIAKKKLLRRKKTILS